VTTAVGIVISANSSNNAASPILIIGRVGAIGWGLQHINNGYAALSEGVVVQSGCLPLIKRDC
jgi:hypothetical protein